MDSKDRLAMQKALGHFELANSQYLKQQKKEQERVKFARACETQQNESYATVAEAVAATNAINCTEGHPEKAGTAANIPIPEDYKSSTQAQCDQLTQGIDAILAERGSRYGKFETHAEITMELKDVMMLTPNWPSLKASHKEALHMIAHKIGRILNGDPNYADSWVDIAGYAKLVADALEGDSK